MDWASWIGVIGVVAGGLIALASSLLVFRMQRSSDDRRWRRDRQAVAYEAMYEWLGETWAWARSIDSSGIEDANLDPEHHDHKRAEAAFMLYGSPALQRLFDDYNEAFIAFWNAGRELAIPSAFQDDADRYGALVACRDRLWASIEAVRDQMAAELRP